MDCNIRFSSGRYDWLHPHEIQDHAMIYLPCLDAPLNLMVKENEFDDLRGVDWSESIPEAIERYVEKTVWSSCLDIAKRALEWAKSDEGQTILQRAWAEKELIYVNGQLEKLEKRKKDLEKLLR